MSLDKKVLDDLDCLAREYIRHVKRGEYAAAQQTDSDVIRRLCRAGIHETAALQEYYHAFIAQREKYMVWIR